MAVREEEMAEEAMVGVEMAVVATVEVDWEVVWGVATVAD